MGACGAPSPLPLNFLVMDEEEEGEIRREKEEGGRRREKFTLPPTSP